MLQSMHEVAREMVFVELVLVEIALQAIATRMLVPRADPIFMSRGAPQAIMRIPQTSGDNSR